MPAAINIHEILSKVEELNIEEQHSLLEKLISLIRKNEISKKSTKLSGITGVGSKIWANTNIEEYLEQERQW